MRNPNFCVANKTVESSKWEGKRKDKAREKAKEKKPIHHSKA
jgi:hypothetical protein